MGFEPRVILIIKPLYENREVNCLSGGLRERLNVVLTSAKEVMCSPVGLSVCLLNVVLISAKEVMCSPVGLSVCLLNVVLISAKEVMCSPVGLSV